MRIVALLALALTQAACPFFDDSDGDGSNYVAIDQVDAATKDAWCTYLARCGEFPDQATCVGAYIYNVPTWFDANIVAAIGAGRVVYNGSNMKLCLDAMANNTCDRTDQNGRANVAACRDLVRGTVAANGSCVIDEECISQQCTGSTTDTACVMGTCIGDTPPVREPAPLGMPCSGLGGCVDGAYCYDDGFNPRCVELKDAGVDCISDDECGYGLGCIGVTGARVCAVLPAPDQPCPDGVCRDEGTYCGSTGTCQHVGLAGSACTTSSQQCSLFFPCDFASGVCKQGPSLGQPCSSSTRCFADGTFCDTSTFTCVTLEPDGTACTSSLQCASELCDLSSSAPACIEPHVCF